MVSLGDGNGYQQDELTLSFPKRIIGSSGFKRQEYMVFKRLLNEKWVVNIYGQNRLLINKKTSFIKNLYSVKN